MGLKNIYSINKSLENSFLIYQSKFEKRSNPIFSLFLCCQFTMLSKHIQFFKSYCQLLSCKSPVTTQREQKLKQIYFFNQNRQKLKTNKTQLHFLYYYPDRFQYLFVHFKTNRLSKYLYVNARFIYLFLS